MNKEEREQMGKNGLDYYLKYFDKKTVVDNIIEAMRG